MALRVQDFESVTTANSVEQLEEALQKRYRDGVNSFWLSHDAETKPSISMLMKSDLAYLHYFPNDSHPGFASVGTVSELPQHKATTFFLDSPDQAQEILNSSIVPLSKALEVAKEFFASKDLPGHIKWSEL
jgi:hypothetical protein